MKFAWGITNLGGSTLFKIVFFFSRESVQTPHFCAAITLVEEDWLISLSQQH